MPATKAAPKSKQPKVRMSLAETMKALEAAGSEQTRKTYLRHGAQEPLFGVSFATLKTLLKAIGVDHELALALWETGNLDARNLAMKIADPLLMTTAVLDHWGQTVFMRGCGNYVAALAVEGGQGSSRAEAWLKSADVPVRALGWTTVAALAMDDEHLPDAWFSAHLAEIERTIHTSPNAQRESMNQALIMIGCRNPLLREAASAAARRTGKVEVDHGDTACKTPEAAASIDKAWSHSTSKGFTSPAAHERSRESMRLRC